MMTASKRYQIASIGNSARMVLDTLLIRYGVAVRTFRTVELKKIDLDYFNAEE
jgi:hypothetical protein